MAYGYSDQNRQKPSLLEATGLQPPDLSGPFANKPRGIVGNPYSNIQPRPGTRTDAAFTAQRMQNAPPAAPAAPERDPEADAELRRKINFAQRSSEIKARTPSPDVQRPGMEGTPANDVQRPGDGTTGIQGELRGQLERYRRQDAQYLELIHLKDREINAERDPARKAALQSERSELAAKRSHAGNMARTIGGSFGEAPKVLDAAAIRKGRADLMQQALDYLNTENTALASAFGPPGPNGKRLPPVSAQIALGKKMLAERGRMDLAMGPNEHDAQEFAAYLGRGAKLDGLSEQERSDRMMELAGRRQALQRHIAALTAAEGRPGYAETMADAEKIAADQRRHHEEWTQKNAARQVALLDSIKSEQPDSPGYHQKMRELADLARVTGGQREVAENQAGIRTANREPVTTPDEDAGLRAAITDFKKAKIELATRSLRQDLAKEGMTPDVAKGIENAITIGTELAGKVPSANQGMLVKVFKTKVNDLRSAYKRMNPDSQAAFRQQVQDAIAGNPQLGESSVAAVNGVWNQILGHLDPTWTPAHDAFETMRAATVDDLVSQLVNLGGED